MILLNDNNIKNVNFTKQYPVLHEHVYLDFCLNMSIQKSRRTARDQLSINKNYLYEHNCADKEDMEILFSLESDEHNFFCILPIEHSGKCIHNPEQKWFCENVIHPIYRLKWDKFAGIISRGVFSTPGNNTNLGFYNRKNRAYPISISSKKHTELFCGEGTKDIKLRKMFIPLSEYSSPLMQSHCCIDILSQFYTLYREPYFSIYKKHLIKMNSAFYDKQNTVLINLVNKDNDVISIDWISKRSIVEHDSIELEFSHIEPKTEVSPTIRSSNVFFMSKITNDIQGNRTPKETLEYIHEGISQDKHIISKLKEKKYL